MCLIFSELLNVEAQNGQCCHLSATQEALQTLFTFHHISPFFYTTALSHQHFATKLVETDELMIQINCANKFDVILVIDCVQLREMRRSFNMGVGKFPFEHQI